MRMLQMSDVENRVVGVEPLLLLCILLSLLGLFSSSPTHHIAHHFDKVSRPSGRKQSAARASAAICNVVLRQQSLSTICTHTHTHL